MKLDALKAKVIGEIIDVFDNISKGKTPGLEFIIQEIEILDVFQDDSLVEFYLTHTGK